MLGAMFVAPFGGIFSNRFGRKETLAFWGIPTVALNIVLYFAQHRWVSLRIASRKKTFISVLYSPPDISSTLADC